MEQESQGCETITADLVLRGVVLEAIAVVLIFDAVCDLDIMNDIAYATRIVTVQKCRVNSITLLSLMHAWESDRSRIVVVVLYRFVMNYVRDREGSNLIKSRQSMLVRIAVGKVSLAPGPFFYHRDTRQSYVSRRTL
jgi:hypothetical protein